MTNKIDIAKQLTEKYIEKNHEFMTDFVQTYRTDASLAKRNYYHQKL